jgi:hypothetical protein
MKTDLSNELLGLLDRNGFCYDALIAINDRCEAYLTENPTSLYAVETIAISTISSIAHATAMRIDRADGSTPVHNYLESKIGPPLRHLLASPLVGDALLEALGLLISAYYTTKNWRVNVIVPSEPQISKN